MTQRGIRLRDAVALGRASAEFVYLTPRRWITDPATGLSVPDPSSYEEVARDVGFNVKTKAGIDRLFANGYSTSPGANGFNWIGLSADALTETVDSTTLSNEIVANGFSRAQGTYSHSAGTATATISKSFTASGAQTIQKGALFTASSGGDMNHALAVTTRTVASGDIVVVTYTITIS